MEEADQQDARAPEIKAQRGYCAIWGAETCQPMPLEMIARVVSWAIFGPAIQWSQEKAEVSSEQMVDAILLVIMEDVARLVPEALPE
jgi:hypothetical protein